MIYFIQNATTLNIKIGWTGSDDVRSRLRELQTGSDAPHILLAVCPGSKEAEHELHKRFASAWVMGEWFRPIPELIQLLMIKAAYALSSAALESTLASLYEVSQREQAIETKREMAAVLLAEIRTHPKHALSLKFLGGETRASIAWDALDPNHADLKHRFRTLENEVGKLLAEEDNGSW